MAGRSTYKVTGRRGDGDGGNDGCGGGAKNAMVAAMSSAPPSEAAAAEVVAIGGRSGRAAEGCSDADADGPCGWPMPCGGEEELCG